MNETQGLVAGLILLLALFLYTFWPEAAPLSPAAPTPTDALLQKQSQLAESLRDLEFEFASGKYTEVDFLAQKKQLEGELATLQASLR